MDQGVKKDKADEREREREREREKKKVSETLLGDSVDFFKGTQTATDPRVLAKAV